jgi:hypothetical protein
MIPDRLEYYLASTLECTFERSHSGGKSVTWREFWDFGVVTGVKPPEKGRLRNL